MVFMRLIQEATTGMFAHLSDESKFLLIALVLAFFAGLFWWWNRRAKKWLEENGREEVCPNELDGMLRDTQQEPATPLKYSGQGFQEMVAKDLEGVPGGFEREWENDAGTG